MAGELLLALEEGTVIPDPRVDGSFSGRFLLPIPSGPHAELARQADEEGASLNRSVATLLAGA